MWVIVISYSLYRYPPAHLTTYFGSKLCTMSSVQSGSSFTMDRDGVLYKLARKGHQLITEYGIHYRSDRKSTCDWILINTKIRSLTVLTYSGSKCCFLVVGFAASLNCSLLFNLCIRHPWTYQVCLSGLSGGEIRQVTMARAHQYRYHYKVWQLKKKKKTVCGHVLCP